MARVDVPTLQCDRCKQITQDLMKMSQYKKIRHDHMSGSDEWDLCPHCWSMLTLFLDGDS